MKNIFQIYFTAVNRIPFRITFSRWLISWAEFVISMHGEESSENKSKNISVTRQKKISLCLVKNIF